MKDFIAQNDINNYKQQCYERIRQEPIVCRYRIIDPASTLTGRDDTAKNARYILLQQNTLEYMPNHMVYIRYDDGDINVKAFKINTQAQHNQQEYEFLTDDSIESERCKRGP